jgi:hypothetical protein
MNYLRRRLPTSPAYRESSHRRLRTRRGVVSLFARAVPAWRAAATACLMSSRCCRVISWLIEAYMLFSLILILRVPGLLPSALRSALTCRSSFSRTARNRFVESTLVVGCSRKCSRGALGNAQIEKKSRKIRRSRRRSAGRRWAAIPSVTSAISPRTYPPGLFRWAGARKVAPARSARYASCRESVSAS